MPPGLLLSVALAAAPSWQKQTEEDGLVLDVQPVAGSSYERVRVTGTSKASPEVFWTIWWGKATDSSASPEVVKREILSDADAERVYWDLVTAPFISDREYVMKMTRRRDEATGALSIRFQSVSDARKPPREGSVPLLLDGSLQVTPEPKGGCRFEYVMFSDVGGAVPAVFVRGAQRKSSLTLSRENRRRAETPPAR